MSGKMHMSKHLSSLKRWTDNICVELRKGKDNEHFILHFTCTCHHILSRD